MLNRLPFPVLAARMRIERTTGRTGKDPVAFSANGRLQARRAGDKWRVATVDFQGGPPELAPMLKAGEQVITVAGPSGALVRLEGVDEAAAASMASMPEGLPPAARARIGQMLPAALTKDATEMWSALVALWAGQDLEIADSRSAARPGHRWPRAPGSLEGRCSGST